jgi:fatty-acyl-CoA synthase/long-chain acyl-CoA synthetase
MSGYRGREGGLRDGWLCTGDHGRVFPGGLFLLSGRRHDRLKVGGFSVFPAEVEAVLDAAPGVREVAVVGVPDPRLGERPVAVVVADEGFDPDAFLAWAAERLAGYRRPRKVCRVDALPRGPNGKIDRGRAAGLAEGAFAGAAPVPSRP